MNTKKVVGVIPARWGSTRFLGKSLAMVGGKPLLVRVIDRVRQTKRLDALLVATDDERIARVAGECGVEAVMTRSDHPSGTDRIAEAVSSVAADVIINIQGDEPLVSPDLIDEVASALLNDPSWDMATACAPIRSQADLFSPDVVKVVCGMDGGALYFSRSAIPFVRDVDGPMQPLRDVHMRHIGLYGYQREFLARFVSTPQCRLEEVEKLEQLRALFIGGRIRVLPCEDQGIGVDSPEDIPKAEELLRKAGLLD